MEHHHILNIGLMAKHNEIGKIGEDLAAKYLLARGHAIVDRNYREKWGEVDIVTEYRGIVNFVEVKSVSYETRSMLSGTVAHETWRPEEKVNAEKLRRLSRAIQTWLQKHKQYEKFQIDVVTVEIVSREKTARIGIIENIIIE